MVSSEKRVAGTKGKEAPAVDTIPAAPTAMLRDPAIAAVPTAIAASTKVSATPTPKPLPAPLFTHEANTETWTCHSLARKPHNTAEMKECKTKNLKRITPALDAA